MTSRFAAALLAVGLLAGPLSGVARATDRHFVYTYESGVLNPGDAELEPWTTNRFGRDRYYNRFDQRVEFELGLVERLQTSFYLNFASITQDIVVEDGTGQSVLVRESETEFEGVSSEWKFKVTD